MMSKKGVDFQPLFSFTSSVADNFKIFFASELLGSIDLITRSAVFN